MLHCMICFFQNFHSHLFCQSYLKWSESLVNPLIGNGQTLIFSLYICPVSSVIDRRIIFGKWHFLEGEELIKRYFLPINLDFRSSNGRVVWFDYPGLQYSNYKMRKLKKIPPQSVAACQGRFMILVITVWVGTGLILWL